MANGNLLVIQNTLKVTAFKLLRFVFVVIQKIYWELNGTANKQREAHHPGNYDRSAHVLDVWLFNELDAVVLPSMSNFICTHSRFESPQYVFDNDNINLMFITDTQAVFCEPPRKDMQLWRSKFFPFISQAQRTYCSKLIVVPFSTLHRMAESIGDPKGELVFIFHTGRCGSTLLSQCLERTEQCVSLSTPYSMSQVAAKYKRFGSTPQLRQLAHDVVSIECRPYRSFQPLAYAIKFMEFDNSFNFFRELFPRSHFLSMYRDVTKVAKSLYRTSYKMPTFWLASYLGRWSSSLVVKTFDMMGYCGNDYNVLMENDLSFGVMVAAVSMKSYLDFRRQGFEASAIRYEDLASHPLRTCQSIMKACGLPVSLAQNAVKALEEDSQRNSVLSRYSIGAISEPQLTQEVTQSLNKLMAKYRLPPINEECILDGTISYFKDD